jgi:hypothetical protein
MKQFNRIIAVLVCSALCPAAPSTACNLSLITPVLQQPLAYNPFQAGSATASISFTLKNADSKPCSAAFALYKPGAPRASSGSTSIAYQILGASGGEITNPLASPPAQLATTGNASFTTVGPNATVTATATLSIKEGQVVAEGKYTDQLTLRIYKSPANTAYIGDLEASLNIAIAVNSQATLAVSGGGRTTTLNFGNLFEGALRSVQLLAYANQGFHLTVSSDNGGVMKPVDPAALAEGWSVPYKVAIFKTESIDLAQQRTASLWPTATQKTGLAIPIDVYIGSTKGQRAGLYRDVITIAIDPGP